MGGRGSGSGMTSTGVSKTVAIPTDKEIDKLKFTKGTFEYMPYVNVPRYTATVGDFGTAKITQHLDKTYSASFSGGDGTNKYTWYENFDDFNSAKRGVKSAIKDMASRARGK